MVVGVVSFIAYYFGVWPNPNLEVEGPLIAEWLESEQVIFHRRAFDRPLDNAMMYLQEGQRVNGVCHWSTILSSAPRESGVKVLKVLATNHSTCERLVSQGTRPR